MQIQAVVDHQGELIEFTFDTQPIPIVTGINPDGTFETARQLAARKLLPAAECDHAGATWSTNLALKCRRCGSPMFLSPRFLAHLPASTLTAMYELWRAAGWPEWSHGSWFYDERYWTLRPHPLFARTGGLLVRNDRQAEYNAAVMEFEDAA